MSDPVSAPRSFPGKSFPPLQFPIGAVRGCAILPNPTDMEAARVTFHPATTLRALWHQTHGPRPMLQPSRRPTDGRYG